MLSIIIQEHNETKEFVHRMLEQVDRLVGMEKEVLYITSLPHEEFLRSYGPFTYSFPISVVGNIQSCGAARDEGGLKAAGDRLLFMDSHVCFTEQGVRRLLDTLDRYSSAVVAPATYPTEFPECRYSGAPGYGVAFRFRDRPFEWVWLPPDRTDREFPVPFVCGCVFAMTKDTFSVLQQHGGFLHQHTGLGWEEEATMRLWRLGHPAISEPRASFGHYFKGYPGHRTWDEHSTQGYYQSRITGFYVNVFDRELWGYIENMLIRTWGSEYTKGLEYARRNFTWLRDMMSPYRNNIDERWFLRTE